MLDATHFLAQMLTDTSDVIQKTGKYWYVGQRTKVAAT
jgi:hypothetical protein